MTRLFHAVTCTPERCDSPRSVAWVASRDRRGREARRIAVTRLPGCPVAYPPPGESDEQEFVRIERQHEVASLLIANLADYLDEHEAACRARARAVSGE